MTTTPAQRTAAHAAFVARRAAVAALLVKHGSTDAGLTFPTAAAETAFFDDLATYDNGANPAPATVCGQTVAALRDSGHCVIVWTPEEIGEADADDLESVSIERGHAYLDDYASA